MLRAMRVAVVAAAAIAVTGCSLGDTRAAEADIASHIGISLNDVESCTKVGTSLVREVGGKASLYRCTFKRTHSDIGQRYLMWFAVNGDRVVSIRRPATRNGS